MNVTFIFALLFIGSILAVYLFAVAINWLIKKGKDKYCIIPFIIFMIVLCLIWIPFLFQLDRNVKKVETEEKPATEMQDVKELTRKIDSLENVIRQIRNERDTLYKEIDTLPDDSITVLFRRMVSAYGLRTGQQAGTADSCKDVYGQGISGDGEQDTLEADNAKP